MTEVLTSGDIALELHIGAEAAAGLVRDGHIESFSVTKATPRVTRAAFEEFIGGVGPVLRVAEIADELKCSRESVRCAISSGRLSKVPHLGPKTFRVSRGALEAFKRGEAA